MAQHEIQNTATDADRAYMEHALVLARRGLGRVSPNPAVGCVIVTGGRVVGRGFTQPGGRPHAETVALAQAGSRAKGATAYVTLEPCAHQGETGPCAEALVRAGVAKVFIAAEDPDPRVNGRGRGILEAAGVAVHSGLLEKEARAVNCGFLKRVEYGRPFVALKLATSLDGKIAARTGQSQWITGAEARQYGHMLRAAYDAIMVGAGTVLADDPELTCRIKGLEAQSPVRIVLDRRLEIPVESRVVEGASAVPTIIATSASKKDTAPFELQGVQILRHDEDADTGTLLARMAEDYGITRLLVEGGAGVHGKLLKGRLVDRIYHFTSGKCLGGDALNAFGPLGLDHVDDAPHFERSDMRSLGADYLTIYDLAE